MPLPLASSAYLIGAGTFPVSYPVGRLSSKSVCTRDHLLSR